MFGYVRPYTPELRVRELELYRAAYCGLCRAIGRKYGLTARCVLSYDFVFLTMLLAAPPEPVRVTRERCPVSLRRKRCLDCGRASDAAAAYGVITAYHKTADDANDEVGFAKLAAFTARAALKRAYARASADYPAFDRAVKSGLDALNLVETDPTQSLDAPAGAFGKILAAAHNTHDTRDKTRHDTITASHEPVMPRDNPTHDKTFDASHEPVMPHDNPTHDKTFDASHEPVMPRDKPFDASRDRILSTLLYHVGRWIYIMDARDDSASDAKKKRPNAITSRGGLSDERLRVTLDNSLSVAAGALELLPSGAYSDILRNIIYLGMPHVRDSVFAGTFNAASRRL